MTDINEKRHPGLIEYQADYWVSANEHWPVFPFCCESAMREQPVHYQERASRFLLIIMLLEGELVYRINNYEEHCLRRGDVLVIPRHSDYEFFSVPDRPVYRKQVIEFKGDLLESTQNALGLDCPRYFKANNFRYLLTLFRKLSEKLALAKSENTAYILGKAQEFLAAIADEVRASTHGTSAHEEQARQLRTLLESPHFFRCTINEIAKEMKISRSYADKLFQKHFGMSPQKYRIQYRLSQAEYYLTHTSLSLKEIAAKLGYSNQLYFSNDFRNQRALSPKMFRNNRRSASTL